MIDNIHHFASHENCCPTVPHWLCPWAPWCGLFCPVVGPLENVLLTRCIQCVSAPTTDCSSSGGRCNKSVTLPWYIHHPCFCCYQLQSPWEYQRDTTKFKRQRVSGPYCTVLWVYLISSAPIIHVTPLETPFRLVIPLFTIPTTHHLQLHTIIYYAVTRS
jgi:hypothetical protein